MSPPPLPKIVTTWAELRKEITALRDFYLQALDVAEDLVLATWMQNEDLLRVVLAKHKDLKPLPPIRIQPETYDVKAAEDNFQN